MKSLSGIILYLFINLLLFGGNFNGCSHSKPYYRADISRPSGFLSDNQTLKERIILIGDAGGTIENDPLLSSLSQWCIKDPSKTHVFFLGDNIYPRGLDEDDPQSIKTAEKYLYAQLEVIQASGVKGTFMPGNHDWGRGGEGGREALLKQERIVLETLQQENAFLPDNACPGPVYMDTRSIRVIIFDSNHWLNDKIDWPADCPSFSEDEFLANFGQLLQDDVNKPIMVLTHHPIESHGPHGGFFDWQDHLFPLTRLVSWCYLPLPVVGSLYPFSRTYLVKNNQDFVGSNYKRFIQALNDLFRDKKPLIYASGHEHNLEVLEGTSVQYLLVSGAGSIPKISPITDSPNTLFAYSHAGFMVLDVVDDGRIILQVIEPPDGKVVFQKVIWSR
ncbi:MAG: metallophosphoesterase [bacterium]|nr:MAG: metallophosphoesterase [bacterium]